ncbi:YihY/virulence factor BrkB family protein [Solibacillus sp. CAU 1738]|uniref:YihY/virulence factor BrkB family protein n=1 Tax=Solibacillus sp. CAU 1738 TaxID=3140363 RepID=UPI00326014B2
MKSFVSPNESEVDVTTIKGFTIDIVNRINRADILGMGAQLAYYFLLSIFPLLIFIVTLLPYLKLQHHQVFAFLGDIMPAEVYMLTEDIIVDALTNQNSGLLSLGFIGTMWSASRGVNALIKGLNRAYDVEGKSGFINRFWSIIFTVSLVVLIFIALIFPVFGQQLGNLLFSYMGIESSFESVWTFIRWITPVALIITVVSVMYWIVPNTDPRLTFSSIIPGTVFATLGWVILTYGFSFYVNNFANYSATYGSIAGVIVLMLWLYFTGIILISGGLLNAALQNRQIVKMDKQKGNLNIEG